MIYNCTDKFTVARATFLDPFGLTEAALDSAIGMAMSQGVEDADIYLQRKVSETYSLENGVVKGGHFKIEQGFGLRAVANGKSTVAHSSEIGASALFEAAKAAGAIGGRASRPISPRNADRDSWKIPDCYLETQFVSEEAKLDILGNVQKIAQKSTDGIKYIAAALCGDFELIYIVKRDGVRAVDIRPSVRLGIHVVLERGGRIGASSGGWGGRCGYDGFTGARLEHIVSEAVRKAALGFDARSVSLGEMPVILKSGGAGLLLHEAIGHGLEADAVHAGRSVYSGGVGERVASEGVTLVDDGTVYGHAGSLAIDDEGNPSRQIVLVERGILRGYLHDETSAHRSNAAAASNGRRESYKHPTLPRMTNTLLLSGDVSPDEILQSVHNGLYVADVGDGEVNITTGNFVLSIEEAYWVERGKIQYPVKGMTLIGNGPNVLRNIGMVGNDMALDSGLISCAKNGQKVPVGVGQPTLRVDKGLTIGQ